MDLQNEYPSAEKLITPDILHTTSNRGKLLADSFFKFRKAVLKTIRKGKVDMKLYGGIEAGGTKIVCIVASGPHDIIAESRFPTTFPTETIEKMIRFFQEQMKEHPLAALGIGTFGPADLDPDSSTFGYITTTPKPGWSNVDLAGPLRETLQIPVAFDTDVNAAVLAEQRWGAGAGIDPLLYFTIGTGIGMGGIINGNLMHGLTHPEAGHMLIHHDLKEDPFEGSCPYHKDCFEGLASGYAMNKRWGQPAQTLPDDHPAWALETTYIATALMGIICTLSPKRIILGGGVMENKHLFPLIRQKTLEFLNGYVQSAAILDDIDQFIVPPGLGNRAGALGTIALAEQITLKK